MELAVREKAILLVQSIFPNYLRVADRIASEVGRGRLGAGGLSRVKPRVIPRHGEAIWLSEAGATRLDDYHQVESLPRRNARLFARGQRPLLHPHAAWPH